MRFRDCGGFAAGLLFVGVLVVSLNRFDARKTEFSPEDQTLSSLGRPPAMSAREALKIVRRGLDCLQKTEAKAATHSGKVDCLLWCLAEACGMPCESIDCVFVLQACPAEQSESCFHLFCP